MIDKKRFKKLFPHLAEEMEKGMSKVRIDGFRTHPEYEDHMTMRRWAGYDPDVIDFIRRCETEDQAKEIIDYMEKRREITPERAAELRGQLRSEGLRSFGDRKERDFYHRNR